MSTSAVTNDTSSTSGASSTSSSSSTSTTKTNALGKDAFLKLLITQMSNQDPMSPTDNTQSIAQLAQFTSLEQMEQLNSSFTTLSSNVASGFDTVSKSSAATKAFQMIGCKIDYPDSSDATSTKTGTVDSVVFEKGWPKLKIGDTSIDMSDVIRAY